MSENLNYSKNNTIGYCYNSTNTSVLGTEGEDAVGCNSPYGRAYLYSTAVDGQLSASNTHGICPSGFHIPNAIEWFDRSTVPLTLAGSYDLKNSRWQNRPASTTIGCGSTGCGFYWYSNALKSGGDSLGFAYVYGTSTFEVRSAAGSGLATSKDLFSVRCVADDDWEPPSSVLSGGCPEGGNLVEAVSNGFSNVKEKDCLNIKASCSKLVISNYISKTSFTGVIHCSSGVSKTIICGGSGDCSSDACSGGTDGALLYVTAVVNDNSYDIGPQVGAYCQYDY